MGNLQSGDILVFKAGDNWLSKCIAKLTDSDVSHAAMYYQDENIVEMSSSGIVCSLCKEAADGDDAYLLRLSPKQDAAPLQAAAKKYLDEKIHYDYPDLVFFAGLIIYRSVRATKRWQIIMDYILEMACAELDKMMNKLIHKDGKKAMVCSQLVYQIYLDCGEKYKIIIHDGLLQAKNRQSEQAVCLADLAAKCDPLSEETTVEADRLASIEFQAPDMEEISRELYEAMEESERKDCELCTAENLGGLVHKARKFLDKMEKILERAGVELPVYALFVAPCDLLKADNLDRKGEVRIKRV